MKRKLLKRLVLFIAVVLNTVSCVNAQSDATEPSKRIVEHDVVPSPIGNSLKTWAKDPFDIKAYIENKGQFDDKDRQDDAEQPSSPPDADKIRYAMINKGAQFYFTSKGWTYRHDSTRELTEEEIIREEHLYAAAVANGEKDKEHVGSKTISSFVSMNWEGANPDAQVIAEDAVAPYFTYPDKRDKSGAACIKANGYSKLIYKDLYPGIDVEYTFPKDNQNGIKYALIVHQGADVSVVKMQYSNASGLYIDKEGNVQIESSFGNFVDHAPVSYFDDGKQVSSGFEVSGNTVSFTIDRSEIAHLKSKTLIVDPFTTNPSSVYTTYDAAFDLDYDSAGNVYIYGGGYPYKEIKLNSAGTILWSYSAASFYNGGCSYSAFTGYSSCYGDFAVDAASGSSYLVEAFNGGLGTHVIKLNSAGALVKTYTPPNNNLSEMWRVQFNNCTKQAIIAGGGTSDTTQACLLDTNLSTLTPVNVLGATSPYHDFTLLTLDNYGNCFMATAQKYVNDGFANNVLIKCPSSTLVPINYMVSDNHTFVEVNSVSYVDGVTSQANGFNGMAADNNYVYTYDGYRIRKWNKSNGTAKSTGFFAGATMFASGGIDVNDCGNLFVGVGTKIYQVDSNYNTIATYIAPGNVYDLAIGPGNLLYVCGANFVGTVSITSTCGNLNLQSTVTPDSCASKGTASVTASGGIGPYSYSWSNGKTTQTITGLPGGSYTVTVTDLGFVPCAKSFAGSQTLVVTVPGASLTVSVTSSQSICIGQSVTLTASGGATTYTWTPTTGLSSGTGSTVTANPTVTTTYTVTGTNASGCSGSASVTVTVNPIPTISVNPNSPAICNGKSVSLTASGGTTYSWSPSTGLSGTTGARVTANPTGTTTYTVTGTVGGGCSNTTSVTVTINPTPTINVSPAAPALCSGQSTSLTASGGTTYTWSPASGLSATTGTSVTANPTSTTTYIVTGTDANGCTNTKSVTVTINPLPTININPSAPKVCSGQSASLTAFGANTYSWSPSSGLSATSGNIVTANPTSTTTYTVTGTDVNGCTNTKSVTVTVNPLPSITVNPAAPTLCSGQSTSLTASGGTTYSWSPASGLSATTGTTVTASPTSTTTYIVTGTDANGCSNTKSVTITIDPPPSITVNPAAPKLCSGQSTSLTASGGATYIWSPASGLSATTGTTVTANPSSTTTYTVTGTDANGCSNTKSVTVTVNPLPSITVNPAAPVLCIGQSTSLTASGGTTYSWSPASGLSATTGTTVTANPSSTTTYTVTGTDANGCSNTTVVTVTIITNPVITINPVSPSLCNGQSVSLTASGANTYTWSPATGLSSGTGATVTANPSSTITYTVTGTATGGCSGTKSITVTVNPIPSITINPVAPTLCSGQSVMLTASGGNTYSWSPSSGLSATTGTSVTANPSSTTTYTVIGTDINGCTNTKSVTVTINPPPSITVNPAAPVLCLGQSTSLTASGGTTYIWSPSSGLSATTGTTVTANPSSTTTYTVTGTDANGCSNTTVVTVTIITNPAITINPVSPSLCNGQSVSLTASGANTYTWSPATGLSATTGAIVTANPSSTITYTVTGTATGGCSGTKTITVTINPTPSITINPVAPTLCSGQSVTLTATGGTTYSWSPSSGLSATTGASVTANPSSTTTYTVIGADINGCTNTKSVTVTINPPPSITVNPSAPVLCSGQSAALTASGGVTYIWSPSSGLSATTGTTVTANPTSTTTYTVTGTDVNGCNNTKSVTLTINPPPSITVNPSAPVLCLGQSTSLTASGGATYIWSAASGLSATTGTTVTANPSSTTTYTVTGTDVNGCSNTTAVTVTLISNPVITINPVSPTLCNGQSVSLTASGANTYTWSPSTGLSATTGATVTANPSSTITYTVTGTATGGCSGTKNITVTINPIPTITINPVAPTLCSGQSVTLTASGGNTYSWSPSSGLSATTGTSVTANPSSTTTYIIIGTDVNGCTNTKSVTVTINPSPSITVNPAAPVLCLGQSTSLTASGGATYIWSPSSGLSATTGMTVTANPSSTTTYTVTGTDVNGCTNTKSVIVTVNPPPSITVNPAAPVLCLGQSISLTASGGVTYSWSPSSGLSATTGSIVTANPALTSTYTITGIDVNGCSNTTSVTVTVISNPVITINPVSPSLCNGQSVSLTASGANTYAWSPSTGLSATTGTTVIANPSTTTTYTITGTATGGCFGITSVIVTVNPLPSITVNPAAPVICYGQSVAITASGASTYSWSPASGLSATTGTTVTADPSSSNTYTVTGTDVNGCTNTSSVTVTVNPLPVVSITPPAPSICLGQSIALNALGASSYTWSPAANLSSSTDSMVIANPTSSITYNVVGTDVNGCTNTSSVTITVNPLPVVSIIPPAPSICFGQSIALQALGASSYAWSPAANLSSTIDSIVIATPPSSYTYTVTGTDINGCTNTSSVMIKVNLLPVVSVIPPSPSICFGQSIALDALGASSYIWSPAAGLSSTTDSTVTADPSYTTIYNVTGTDNNGCTSTVNVTVTVNPLPVVNAGPDQDMCPNASVQINVTGPPPGSTYIWSPASNLSCNNCSDPLASPLVNTTYIVTATTPAGCSSQDTVAVVVIPISVSAGPDTTVCYGSSVQLYATGGTKYSWAPQTGLSDPTTNDPVAYAESNVTYTVTVTSGVCSSTATASINLFPTTPYPNLKVKDDTLFCTTNPIYKYYQWYYNDTIIPNATKSFYIAPQSGNYNVAVTDTNGCELSVGINIVITGLNVALNYSSIHIYPVPATDKLFIAGYGDEENVLLTIYNMIGEKVLEEEIKEKDHTYVNLQNIATGIYIIEIRQPRNSWMRRFIKE